MLRGKPKAQKEKSLPQLNHFLTEKVAKSVVRSSFLVYHLFAVRIRLFVLLCLRIVCRRPRHCPCLKCFHSGGKPDEKSDGPHHLTFPLQGSILRGSEIFGYDEKEYPERMLQRAAGLVQGSAGRPWEDPLRAFRLNGRHLRPSKRERQAPVITGRALLDAH